MWAARFFSPWYWAARYWPKRGATAATFDPAVIEIRCGGAATVLCRTGGLATLAVLVGGADTLEYRAGGESAVHLPTGGAAVRTVKGGSDVG